MRSGVLCHAALVALTFFISLSWAQMVSPPRRHSRIGSRRASPTTHLNVNATYDDLEARGLSKRASPSNLVFAHFMVGYTAAYSIADWANNIAIAQSKGIDAFALNFGPDNWQAIQVSNAHIAAISSGSFKLFLSFDMSAWACQSPGDANGIQQFINGYNGHPNEVYIDGKMLVSTFGGEGCRFGTGDVNTGWWNTVKANMPPTYFVPAFFVDPATFGGYTALDGVFNWNAAWPTGNFDTNFDSDQSYLNNLGGRGYMAGVSPWFFTHYGPNSFSKNWIYRADDWLWAERWEQLVQNRNQVTFAQVISWNDYSESHYIGLVDGVQPNSQSWVDDFDHQGWLDLMKYYITAYKTGVYPIITKDRVFLWGRLYPAGANAPDPVPRPTNWEWTQDYLWAVVLLQSPGSVTLSCGPSIQTFSVGAGLSKLKLPLTETCSVSSQVVRNGITTVTFSPPGFNFNTNPPSYNFNAFVAASPS
ncbi:unnamed protein product [Somion occarium]|uniref:Glycoside hydrolase family 71 protein n=1 Tax=Somion occarium TaxID=3059160 RepID=A0ABP1DRH6_9APHY